jgi:Tfp pilus assembly protein PilF
MTVFARVCALAAVLALTGWVAPAAAQQVLDSSTKDEHGFERQLTTVDMMQQTAAQLMTAKQFDKAAEELEKVVQQEPGRVSAWQDLGACYRELKDYPNAARAFSEAHKLEPERLDLLSNLGHSQIMAAEQAAKSGAAEGEKNDYKAAIRTYDDMLTIDPTNYDAAVHLGFLYQKENQPDKAAEFYEKAIASNPEDAQSLGSLAGIYAEQKNNAKAIET